MLIDSMNSRTFPSLQTGRNGRGSLLCLLLLLAVGPLWAANYPEPLSTNCVIRDFKFLSGETLPELRMHCRTLGAPQRDVRGMVTNAVLILHGTTGSSSQFLRPEFAGELFGKGEPLD